MATLYHFIPSNLFNGEANSFHICESCLDSDNSPEGHTEGTVPFAGDSSCHLCDWSPSDDEEEEDDE